MILPPQYLKRIIDVVFNVITHGKEAGFFDGREPWGWFCLARKSGAAALSFAVEDPLGQSVDPFHHYQRCAEQQTAWLSVPKQHSMTSSLWEENSSDAVAVTGYDFYFSYASGLSRQWNEAIVVAVAMRMHQFNPRVIDTWPLRDNLHIKQLLEVAHWTE